ncbi:S46 family peptidase, partial [Pseudomonas sp. BJa3]|uniref:S46 family peptidase n=1 Tax=Pseudomonas sp. BJa3 TaxID=2986525 RepID=UPI002265AAE3
VNWTLPARVAVFDQLIEVIEAAGKQDADAKTRYAAQLQSLKNNRKRAAGELEGLRRSDAVRVRAEDERGMLATAAAEKERADI